MEKITLLNGSSRTGFANIFFSTQTGTLFASISYLSISIPSDTSSLERQRFLCKQVDGRIEFQELGYTGIQRILSVADPDPGSGAFLIPGSGIRNRFVRIPHLGSQTHIFGSLVTIFWVKGTIILSVLAQSFSSPAQNKIIFNYVKFEP